MNLDGSGQTAITGTDARRTSASTASGLTFLVYQSNETGNQEVFRSNFDGTGAVNLTSNSAADFDPVVSSDGSRVAFLSNRGGSLGLYVMNSNGTGVTLVSSLVGIEGVSLNADGSRVVFSAAPNGVPQIFVANTTGGAATNLSQDENFFDQTPVFSPDGQTIAFVRDFDLWTMSASGAGKTFRFSLGDEILFPSFTSDGSRIVFMGSVNLAYDIFSVSASGTGQLNLTNTPTDEFKSSGYVGQ